MGRRGAPAITGQPGNQRKRAPISSRTTLSRQRPSKSQPRLPTV